MTARSLTLTGGITYESQNRLLHRTSTYTSVQIIFKGRDPYDPSSWSNAIHFNFTGYDVEPFWDANNKTYITGAHAWQVGFVPPPQAWLLNDRFLLKLALTMSLQTISAARRSQS